MRSGFAVEKTRRATVVSRWRHFADGSAYINPKVLSSLSPSWRVRCFHRHRGCWERIIQRGYADSVNRSSAATRGCKIPPSMPGSRFRRGNEPIILWTLSEFH